MFTTPTDASWHKVRQGTLSQLNPRRFEAHLCPDVRPPVIGGPSTAIGRMFASVQGANDFPLGFEGIVVHLQSSCRSPVSRPLRQPRGTAHRPAPRADPAVKHVDVVLFLSTDDSIGLEQDLPILLNPAVERFMRAIPAMGMLREACDALLEPIEQIVRSRRRLVSVDAVDNLFNVSVRAFGALNTKHKADIELKPPAALETYSKVSPWPRRSWSKRFSEAGRTDG